jgi:hypothetical protein
LQWVFETGAEPPLFHWVAASGVGWTVESKGSGLGVGPNGWGFRGGAYRVGVQGLGSVGPVRVRERVRAGLLAVNFFVFFCAKTKDNHWAADEEVRRLTGLSEGTKAEGPH